MTTAVAVDTSVAVALLVASHDAHERVSEWARGKTLGMSGHALVETYSVLTRLPGEARLAPEDAVVLIDDNFPLEVVLNAKTSRQVHREFASLGISGGAVYDALVGLAARESEVSLATRDARARSTYEALGIRLEIVE